MKMSFDEVSRLPRRTPLSLGSALIHAGVLSVNDVKRIAEARTQSQRRLHFSEAALGLGMVTANEMRYALAHRFGQSMLQPGHHERVIDSSLIAACDPSSKDVEPIRTIRTQLMLRWYDKSLGHNALAVASPGRGEGRSHLAASIAIAFAQAGENVLLIDGDLRGPRLHDLFDVDNRIGLTSFLSEQTTSEPISHIDELPGLFLMPAGSAQPNPLELLCRPSWAELLSEAKETFDIVIIDTPALAAGEDAVLTASRAGAALVVARSGSTRTRAFSDMVRGMSNSGIEVVGSVLNMVANANRSKGTGPMTTKSGP